MRWPSRTMTSAPAPQGTRVNTRDALGAADVLDAGHLSDFKHKEQERLPRQQAAEQMIDIGHALTAGGPLELSAAGRRITVPVANELRLELSHKPRPQPIPFSPVTTHLRAAVRARCYRPQPAFEPSQSRKVCDDPSRTSAGALRSSMNPLTKGLSHES
jgi:hypothetical protein